MDVRLPAGIVTVPITVASVVSSLTSVTVSGFVGSVFRLTVAVVAPADANKKSKSKAMGVGNNNQTNGKTLGKSKTDHGPSDDSDDNTGLGQGRNNKQQWPRRRIELNFFVEGPSWWLPIRH